MDHDWERALGLFWVPWPGESERVNVGPQELNRILAHWFIRPLLPGC